MAEISAAVVKALRERTGAGMMDCKKALADAARRRGARRRAAARARPREGREARRARDQRGRGRRSRSTGAAGAARRAALRDRLRGEDARLPGARRGARATLAAVDEDLGDADALLAAKLGGEKVSERIAAAMSKIGENIVLKRVGAPRGAGGRPGGRLRPRRRQARRAGRAARAGRRAGAGARQGPRHARGRGGPEPGLGRPRRRARRSCSQSERELYRRQAEQEGKPAPVIEKIVEGRVRKFYAEVCLLEQPFVKDPDHSVAQAARGRGRPRWAGRSR